MADFLKLHLEKTNRCANNLGIEYIKYVQDKLEEIREAETLIIFDISDQFIGGLLISKRQKNLLNISNVYTDKIHAYEIDNEKIDNLIEEGRPDFVTERNWLLDKETIHEGLNWSIKKIMDISN